MLAADERTQHQRSTKHRSVRSQQKPALGLSQGTLVELYCFPKKNLYFEAIRVCYYN